ncbi:hypothetical protein J7337_006294 [Fusarium musae]|uniref:Heterokaryon incompatibility domain-containing protein n=1 Tax=Fusarium musae TaxID=1042133 RepID=A0A9P8IRT8_9HYPO|nr:hypothetical protein J7337_006294 [Fusarium musae]KAG9503449.1 hypothetical protein J7337_006294 [Fusarium musae]
MTERALAIDYYKIDSTQIRILILQLGVDDDEVVCTLVPVYRDEAEYHALSYEWGAESKDDPDITVHDRKVQIRRNLFDALRSIRKPMEDQILRVDAICINQSDVDEKSEQVAMMGNTFSGAIGVIAWLGPANDDSDLAMDLLSNAKSLRASLPFFRKEKYIALSLIINWVRGQRLKLTGGSQSDIKLSREAKALSSLCHRSYWRRIWIVQELYLAQSFVVWCGAKSITGDNFDDSMGALFDWKSPFNGDKDFAKNPAYQQRLARFLRPSDSSPGLNDLRRWLWICLGSDFQCSREQDFVHALLDISFDYEAVKDSFKVDYSKPLRVIFLELLWQRNLSTWQNRPGDEKRWLNLAKKMNLSIDEDLKGEISARFSRHES